VSVPPIGERYRGVEGHSGFLLRQAMQTFRGAMEGALREHGVTPAQYSVLSVLGRDPGLSAADLARATNTTPQAINGVVATLERAGLVERHPHPTHGRIQQLELTTDGQRRLEAATPAVRELESAIEQGFSEREIAAVKAWLVVAAERLERAGAPAAPAARTNAR
jgi:DNA-binding MarR family transcriptional regulator